MFICAYKELQIEQQEAVLYKNNNNNNKCFSSGSDYSLFFGCIALRVPVELCKFVAAGQECSQRTEIQIRRTVLKFSICDNCKS